MSHNYFKKLLTLENLPNNEDEMTTLNSLYYQSILLLVFTGLFFLYPGDPLSATESAPGREMAKQATQTKKHWITADHAKHDMLMQPFSNGPEVTKACLSCHTEAALQFHQTIHWTWKDPGSPIENQLGKGGLSVNNF